MKKLLLLLLSSLVAAAPLTAQDAPKPAQPPAHKQKKEKDHPDTDIEKAMKKMGGAFRKLRGQAKAGAFTPDAVDLVATMKAAATEAAKHDPLKTKEIPEADRAKFVADYKAKMDEFNTTLDSLTEALKAGKTTDAVALVGKLGKLQHSGHEEFQPKDY